MGSNAVIGPRGAMTRGATALLLGTLVCLGACTRAGFGPADLGDRHDLGDQPRDGQPPPSRSLFTLDVDGQANIYGAGHASPPAPTGGPGLLPSMLQLPVGRQRCFRMLGVTGSIAYFLGNEHDADGQISADIPDAPVYGGLAGPIQNDIARYLAAVLLDDQEPQDPAPSPIDFGDGTFHEISPTLRQIFFVGDGLSGHRRGEPQVFVIPAQATRLFFGFIDRVTGESTPGSYTDNSGSLHLELEVLVGPR